ncbi:rhomboid family intramembrane serine protease [Pseudomonas sp. HK3]
MPFACHCDDQHPIEPLLHELNQQGIGYEVKQVNGTSELWLDDPQLIEPVIKAYNAYKNAQNQQKQHALSIQNLKQLPITTTFIVISLAVALLTQLGEQFLDFFFIAQMQYYPRGWIPYTGIANLWHSISPIFLHFGIEHLVFNSLSFWYLGSILERKLSFISYLTLVVCIALVSNYSQLFVSGPLFGGLSGVVYGLIGFAFVFQTFYRPLFIPNGLFYLAIGWILLGLTPFFALIGLGNMANTAHISGLICGAVLFLPFYLFVKKENV